MSELPKKFRFSIDRGGTFTDVFAQCPSGLTRVCKLLSKSDAYPDAPTEGIRRIIEMDTATSLPPSNPIPSTLIDSIRMGTTVATNALLERKGAPTALLITKGFHSLLHIGNQSRPQIFDLTVTCPSNLYAEVVEIDERVILQNNSCKLNTENLRTIQTPTSSLFVLKELDEPQIEQDLRKLFTSGIKSLAIVLVHSWLFDEHELRVKKIAERIGFKHVSCSSEVMRMIRIVPRGFTTVVDSYTTPLIKDYLESFKTGFTDLTPSQVLFMQSDGGLTTMTRFSGSRAILSGPAGGVVGYARTVHDKYKLPVIGFDMGGTSTDVSRYNGEFLHSFENITAGVQLQTAQLDIQTVAAGGGSILAFASGIYTVGPESAGANPGPVAYDQGGTSLTITDANLILNRLIPSRFPHIFGPNHDSPLNVKKTLEHFQSLTNQINEFNSTHSMPKVSIQEVALGFIRVANEAMSRPIRNITQGKGYDPSTHMLACFGGAGGQHACAIAEGLGVRGGVAVPRFAGILSAVGIYLADVVAEDSEPVGKQVMHKDGVCNDPQLESYVTQRFKDISNSLSSKLTEENGNTLSQILFEKYLNIRYSGTDCSLMVRIEDSPNLLTAYVTKFVSDYSQQFGFKLETSRPLVIDDLRVRAVGKTSSLSGNELGKEEVKASESLDPLPSHVEGYFDKIGKMECAVYEIADSDTDLKYEGPCLLIDKLSTIVVEPGWIGIVEAGGSGAVKMEKKESKKQEIDDTADIQLDSIVLSVFSHRFMSIAEQMGRILQRTSVSTNIKERLDFSCAIFGEDGGLVSNAPHIPVHLGAMQEAVQYQLRVGAACECKGCKDKTGDTSNCLKLFPGDVILSNHPVAGGSHLPDLTVITPVFESTVKSANPQPIFFVANRGHHADIGGITPGSMPPNSNSIHEEGAVFKTFKMVKAGVFMEAELIHELTEVPKSACFGSSGTRNLSDNLSDLRAQVAANQKGIGLLQSLIGEYSLHYIQTYMRFIQENAELSVRDMLKSVAKSDPRFASTQELSAVDFMDDGSEIRLKVKINAESGEAFFDFGGSGIEVIGNCNAPRAITLSAVIYCLRCLVGRDIPLNQGCLRPITINIPEGSILSPSEDAAVVGGNVQTSQRIVDVIFKAFGAAAASQGDMNNVTFGNESSGYYETVAGGAGAGPTWEGRSGVHVHMTNTRITDVEILELRYPVLLTHFSLRKDSGGKGLHNGGDGVRREILFRDHMTLSVLTERRVFAPYGLKGGQDGSKGRNTLIKAEWRNPNKKRIINLGGKTSVCIEPGDLFILESPGGGGWGEPI